MAKINWTYYKEKECYDKNIKKKIKNKTKRRPALPNEETRLIKRISFIPGGEPPHGA